MRSPDPNVQNQLQQRMAGGVITPAKQFEGVLDAMILDTDVSNPTVNPAGQCRVVMPNYSATTQYGPCPYPAGATPNDGDACIVAFIAPTSGSTPAAQVRVLTVYS